MGNLFRFIMVTCCVFAVSVFAGCGSSGSSGSGGTTTADTTASKTVPDDVVLSSPTATSSASASISKSTSKVDAPSPGAKPGDPTGNDFRSKRESLENLISATGECGFTMQLPTISNVSCYGPVVNYVNHPDFVPGPGPGSATGGLPPQDTGLWSALEGTEACSAAKMNELVDKVAARVDNIVKIFGTMACAGKKAGVNLPAVNQELDVKNIMTENISVGGLTVVSASLTRLPDDSGNEVYKSEITVEMGFGGGVTSTSNLILKHIPTAADNSTYKGKMSFKMSNSSELGNNCRDLTGSSASGSTLAGTILYEKTSATHVTYEVNYAEFCGSTADPFDADNNILPSDVASASNPDGWANNWHYGVFSVNPSDGTGDVAFAWQAGAGDFRTRVLDCTTASASDSSASGTCYYGFGPNISSTTATKGSIDGFVCNWAGPNGAIESSGGDRSAAGLAALNPPRGWSKAQRQVLAKAVGGTEFTPSSSNIRYAVTNSCDALAGGGFTYQAVDDRGNALAADNDKTNAATAVTNDLIALTDMVFTVPTPPTDVK